MSDLSGVWRYDTATEIADPGAGKLRTSEESDRAAISTLTLDGADRSAELRALETWARLLIVEKTNATKAMEFALVTDAIDRGTWVEIAIEKIAATPGVVGEPTKNTDLVLVADAAEVTDAGTEFLPDDLPPEEAAEIVALARLVLAAAIYPNELPPDPLPAPLEIALALVANSIYRLQQTEAAGALPVISESIGAYSYRLQTPGSPEATLILSDAIRGLIEPWLPVGAGSAYELHTGRRVPGWPIDWWQRDLDNDFPNFAGPLLR